MLSYQEALQTILIHSRPMESQELPLGEALGYTLCHDIIAPMDWPAFDNSAMDGYGVRVSDLATASEDTPVSLRVIGEIQAGDAGERQINPGEAVRIFTGAPTPSSVEAVVMQEYCDRQGDAIAVTSPVRSGENIRLKGEAFYAGDRLLLQNTPLTPSVIGLLASIGEAEVTVHRRPRVGILSTGNELVPPGKALEPGQIYDSNSYALSAALRALGLDHIVFHTGDSQEQTQAMMLEAFFGVDVLITLGGVSVGEHDVVKNACESLNVETHFWKINIKPGKPVYFGTKKRENGYPDALVFGLPGNPVSALVTYHQLVKPALLKLMGYPKDLVWPTLRYARLEETIHKKPGRLEFVRGVVEPDADGKTWIISPTTGQDSHMLSGLAPANALIEFPAEAETLEAGETVPFYPLEWSLPGGIH